MNEFTWETLNYVPLPRWEESTLPEFLLARAAENAGKGKSNWMVDASTGQTYDFENFDEMTRKVASALYKRGMRKGDSVLYMHTDLVRLHIFFAGVWRANGWLRASYAEDTSDTVLQRINEYKSKWIICDSNMAAMCLDVARSVTTHTVEIISMGRVNGCLAFDDLFEDDGKSLPNLEITSSDPAIVFCTSGTTGASKGALHTHSGSVKMLRHLSQWLPFHSDSRNLVMSRGTHVSGAFFPLAILSSGGTNLCIPSNTKEEMVKAIAIYKPTCIFAFAPYILMLKTVPESDIASLTSALTGGMQITPPIRDSILSIGNIKDFTYGYGLTEHILVALTSTYSEIGNISLKYKYPDFSVGRVLPDVQVQIRDPTTLVPLGPNEHGELCVKSDMLFQLYTGNPEATQESLVDGFFRTGDLGYVDDKGFLYIVDRLKEIFKYFNNHISPTEIEAVVNKHPAVAEVCVVGIPAEDGGGHIPRAFVTLKQGVEPNGVENDIREYANAQLASYKQIKAGVYVVSSLPKGNTGKVSRILAGKLPI